jgi:NAD(P)-dependent dehydrogenase (short-subunit alcohol dehydrogenase family)
MSGDRFGIPDQGGRVAFVTGANTGIGRETALALARAGATVLVGARDAQKGEAAVASIREASRNDDVHLVRLDLASFASIRAAASRIVSEWSRLDLLINNAGLVLSERTTTTEGFETLFGVNHLGHFLLTTLLLDRLRASAPARIVNVSSLGHIAAPRGLDFDDLQWERRRFSSMQVYGHSKLANILFTRELARRLRDDGVSAFAVHPGFVSSEFGSAEDLRGWSRFAMQLSGAVMQSAERGAGATLHAATAPGLEAHSGSYLARGVTGNFGAPRVTPCSPAARDAAAAARLWQASEDLVASAMPASSAASD